MDLTLPHQSVPTLAGRHHGYPRMRIAAPPWAIGQPPFLASVLPTQFGSINEYRVEVAQCRTERQKSSLGDAGLECCGELYDR
jgi:hypothetical protein